MDTSMEGDIWNYQPKAKTKRSLDNNDCPSDVLDKESRQKTGTKKPTKMKSDKYQFEMIDVDLEPDFDVLSTSSLCTKPNKMPVKEAKKSLSQIRKNDVAECSDLKRKSIGKCSDSITNSSENSVQKSHKSSLCKSFNHTQRTDMTNIKKYFSPTKSNSAPTDLLHNRTPLSVHFSSDDVVVIDSDSTHNLAPLSVQFSSDDVVVIDPVSNIPEVKRQSFADENNIKSKEDYYHVPKLCLDSKDFLSFPTNSEPMPSDPPQLPIVEVNIVSDEEEAATHDSVIKKGKGKQDLYQNTNDYTDNVIGKQSLHCSPALTSSGSSVKENSNSNNKLFPECDIDTTYHDSGGFLLDNDDDDFFNDPTDSNLRLDVEANLQENVYSKFNQMPADTSKEEEILNARKPRCKDGEKLEAICEMTHVKYSEKPEDQTHCDLTSNISDLESSGGFFTDANEPTISKSAFSTATINSKPFNLLSSVSCQAALSSSAKQTDLFTFFKVRPGSGSTSKAADVSHDSQPSVVRSKSIPSAHRGTKLNQPQRPSSSSGWGNKRLPSDGTAKSNGRDVQAAGKKKYCPFYKKIPGTSITVDAFRYGVIPGCEAYILTHFHYDHYGGLAKKFAQPLFCSEVTGNLVESRIGVDKRYINRLPMWKPCTVAGVTLTLMEANHCPGAVIILFELKDGRKILHTGDFRASQDMESYSSLQRITISELYLDTTYCNPSYAFPDQREVVEFVVNLVLNHIAAEPSTLVVSGAYTIGKERIFTAIAKALDSKICVMNDKKKVLDCLEDSDLKSRVTLDWTKGRVHVLPMGKLNYQGLKEHHTRHSQYKTVLALQPTGWTHSGKQDSLENLKPKWCRDSITLYGVPYSEHSSYLELKRFVQHFKPLKILPTVNNGSPGARAKMEAIFKEWINEKRIF